VERKKEREDKKKDRKSQEPIKKNLTSGNMSDSTSTSDNTVPFAKVMQQIEAAGNASGLSELSSNHGGLMSPEKDLQEVLRAPSKMLERRLWEKIYNRTLFHGCTHRQALSVTERILRKGQSAALEILGSSKALSKEVQSELDKTGGKTLATEPDKAGAQAVRS